MVRPTRAGSGGETGGEETRRHVRRRQQRHGQLEPVGVDHVLAHTHRTSGGRVRVVPAAARGRAASGRFRQRARHHGVRQVREHANDGQLLPVEPVRRRHPHGAGGSGAHVRQRH